MSMYLEPSRYDQIESQVIRLFSNINVNHFPIDCFALCKQLCVKVVPYSKLNEKTIAAFGNENKDGISVEMEIAQGVFEWTIYYNDEMPKRRIRFTIMHELGHIWLDHTEHSELAEAEANHFAKYSLAPPPLIHQLQIEDYIELAERFELSEECAYYAMQFYNKWLRFGSEHYSEHEKKLISLFRVA